MADIFAEVDEAMRQERLAKIWKQYGNLIIAGIVALILGTASVSGYKAWNKSTSIAGTQALMTLLDDTNFPNNVKTAELDMRPGLKAIALITAAGAFLADDKNDEALALYERAAGDKSIPGDLRQLATLMSVRLLAGQESNETDLLARLKPIWSDDKSPWRFHARLEAASLQANRQQDFASAREHLNVIQEQPGLPDTLYSTARALSHVYSLKQQKQDQQKNTDKGS